MIIRVYVDDLVLAAAEESTLQRVKGSLRQRFEMTDIGPVHYVLGIQVERTGASTLLHQAKFTSAIIENYGIAECKPIGTPREPNSQLVALTEADDAMQKTEY